MISENSREHFKSLSEFNVHIYIDIVTINKDGNYRECSKCFTPGQITVIPGSDRMHVTETYKESSEMAISSI